MNWKLTPLAASIFSVMGLASCLSFPKKDGSTIIKYPTVSQMAQFDAQWGLPPKPDSTAGGSSSHTAAFTPATTTPKAASETPPAETPVAVPPTLR